MKNSSPQIKFSRWLLACSAVGICALYSFGVGDAQGAEVTASPPESYRLNTLSIQITRQPASDDIPARRLTLAGAGSITLEQAKQSRTRPYAPRQLLRWINELYRIRFFDLATQQSTHFAVFLSDAGMVETSVLRMLDRESTRVCFRLPDYEKCVVYSESEATELDKLVRRIFAEAAKLTETR